MKDLIYASLKNAQEVMEIFMQSDIADIIDEAATLITKVLQ